MVKKRDSLVNLETMITKMHWYNKSSEKFYSKI